MSTNPIERAVVAAKEAGRNESVDAAVAKVAGPGMADVLVKARSVIEAARAVQAHAEQLDEDAEVAVGGKTQCDRLGWRLDEAIREFDRLTARLG